MNKTWAISCCPLFATIGASILEMHILSLVWQYTAHALPVAVFAAVWLLGAFISQAASQLTSIKFRLSRHGIGSLVFLGSLLWWHPEFFSKGGLSSQFPPPIMIWAVATFIVSLIWSTWLFLPRSIAFSSSPFALFPTLMGAMIGVVTVWVTPVGAEVITLISIIVLLTLDWISHEPTLPHSNTRTHISYWPRQSRQSTSPLLQLANSLNSALWLAILTPFAALLFQQKQSPLLFWLLVSEGGATLLGLWSTKSSSNHLSWIRISCFCLDEMGGALILLGCLNATQTFLLAITAGAYTFASAFFFSSLRPNRKGNLTKKFTLQASHWQTQQQTLISLLLLLEEWLGTTMLLLVFGWVVDAYSLASALLLAGGGCFFLGWGFHLTLVSSQTSSKTPIIQAFQKEEPLCLKTYQDMS